MKASASLFETCLSLETVAGYNSPEKPLPETTPGLTLTLTVTLTLTLSSDSVSR